MYGFENNGWIFDTAGVRIIVDIPYRVGYAHMSQGNLSSTSMYEICSYNDSGLTIGELKLILGEIYNFHQNCNDSAHYYCRILLTHYCSFFGMNDTDVIPVKKSRSSIDIDMMREVYFVQYPIDFWATCERDKPRVLGKKRVCSKRENCNVVKKMKDPDKRESILKNNKQMKNAEQHLRQCDHGQLLPFDNCPFGINCQQFTNLCNSTSVNANVEDVIHMHLFRHPSHHLVAKSGNNINTSSKDFEYIGSGEYTRPDLPRTMLFNGFGSLCGAHDSTYDNIMILLLMQEVINNNFEDQLEPLHGVKWDPRKSGVSTLDVSDDNKNDASINYFNYVLQQYKADALVHSLLQRGYLYVYSMRRRIESINWSNIMIDLGKEYKLLDTLAMKMNDPKHVAMGSPLKKHQLFAIILYTNTSCMYDLSEQIRKQDCNNYKTSNNYTNNRNNNSVNFGPKKWKCFDFVLYYSINQLSKYETHDENIYNGLAGVYLDETKFDDGNKKNHLLLKGYTSFSTDLSVAENFAASNGLIIGINMKNIKKIYFNQNVGSMCNKIGVDPNILNLTMQESYVGLICCDVSWISKFPTEREVLMAKHSLLPISRQQIFRKANCQYVISSGSADINDHENVSFEDMFCKYTKLNYG